MDSGSQAYELNATNFCPDSDRDGVGQSGRHLRLDR